MAFISVRLTLALASTIFILLVIAIALLFGILANEELEQSGYEIGNGELHAYEEIFQNRLSNLKHRCDSATSDAQASNLWTKNASMYNASSVVGVDTYFNDTLRSAWATDIYESPGWAIGYGLQAFIESPYDGSFSWTVPQVYYDALGDRSRGYNVGTRNQETGVIDLHYFKVGNISVEATTNLGANKTRITARTLDILEPSYGYSHDVTSYASRTTLTGEEGVWEDIYIWQSADNFTYHFFTYVSPPGILPNSNEKTIVNTVGWISASNVFEEVETVGTVMVIDMRHARIITTNKNEMNHLHQQNIGEQLVVDANRSRVVDIQDSELGINFPDANTKAVFRMVYPSLATLDPEEGSDGYIATDGDTHVQYFIESRILNEDLGLAIVWFAPRQEVMGAMEQQQIIVAVSVGCLALIVAGLVVLASYRSVVGPLRHLSASLKALSELNMKEVEKLEEDVPGGANYSVHEISSLFSSYTSVRNTMTTCLPYIPQIDGDLRLGQMEDEIMQSSVLEDISPWGSEASSLNHSLSDRNNEIPKSPSGSDSKGRSLTENESPLRTPLQNPLRGRHRPSVFGMLDRSCSHGNPVSAMADGALSHRAQNPFAQNSFASPQPKKKKSGKVTFGQSTSLSSITSDPSGGDLSTNGSSGKFTSVNSASGINQVSSSVNTELVMKDRAVVAHFRLRPDVQYDSNLQGGSLLAKVFKEASFLLQYYVTKSASEHKGSVFHFGTSEVFCVWAGAAQPEKKAVEAATQAVETLLTKCIPLFVGHKDLTIPTVTVGITQGPVLLGTTGTLLKRSYVCEGPAVKRAAILSHVGHQIRAHILTDPAVRDGASMFAELRPVEEVRIPAFRTSVLAHKSNIMTVWECIGTRGSTKISANLGEGVNQATGAGGTLSNKKTEKGESLEWMYELQAQEKEEASRLALASEAHEALVKVDLAAYRTALQKWNTECYCPHDLFLVQRYKNFCEVNDTDDQVIDITPIAAAEQHRDVSFDVPPVVHVNNQEDSPKTMSEFSRISSTRTLNPEQAHVDEEGDSGRIRATLGSMSASLLSGNGNENSVTRYFDRLRAEKRPYYRDTSVLCSFPFPYENGTD